MSNGCRGRSRSPAWCSAVSALVAAALIVGEPERIWMSVLGALIALALIGGIYLASNAYYGQDVAFGFGDVILAPLLGMFLGWLNPGIVAPGLFFGFILGTLGAIPAMIGGKATAKTQLPFGPFLALGAVIAVFVGQHFVDLVLDADMLDRSRDLTVRRGRIRRCRRPGRSARVLRSAPLRPP